MLVRRRVHGRPAVPSTQLVHWWHFFFLAVFFTQLHAHHTIDGRETAYADKRGFFLLPFCDGGGFFKWLDIIEVSNVEHLVPMFVCVCVCVCMYHTYIYTYIMYICMQVCVCAYIYLVRPLVRSCQFHVGVQDVLIV